jgi:hypothetical protein
VTCPGETGPRHVVAGTQRDNMARMGRTGRGGGHEPHMTLIGPSPKFRNQDILLILCVGSDPTHARGSGS